MSRLKETYAAMEGTSPCLLLMSSVSLSGQFTLPVTFCRRWLPLFSCKTSPRRWGHYPPRGKPPRIGNTASGSRFQPSDCKKKILEDTLQTSQWDQVSYCSWKWPVQYAISIRFSFFPVAFFFSSLLLPGITSQTNHLSSCLRLSFPRNPNDSTSLYGIYIHCKLSNPD